MSALLPDSIEQLLQQVPETEMKAMIQERVLELLRNDFNFLINSLYRMDIKESIFNEAMAQPTENQIAQALAEAIYNREIQKAESRRKNKQ